MTLFSWLGDWADGKRTFRLCNGEEGLVVAVKDQVTVTVAGKPLGTFEKENEHKLRRALHDYVMGITPSEPDPLPDPARTKDDQPQPELDPPRHNQRGKKSKRKTKKKVKAKAKVKAANSPNDEAAEGHAPDGYSDAGLDLGAQMDAALGESEDD